MCAATCSAAFTSSSASKYSSITCKQSSHFISHPQIRLNAAPHFSACAVQIGLQFGDRKSGNLGNLLITTLLKDFQRKNFAFVGVQTCQRRLNNEIQFFIN